MGCIVRDCLGDCVATQSGAGQGRQALSSDQAQDVTKIVASGSGKTALKFIAFSALVLVTGLVVAFGKKDWLLGGPLAALAPANPSCGYRRPDCASISTGLYFSTSPGRKWRPFPHSTLPSRCCRSGGTICKGTRRLDIFSRKISIGM